MNEPSDGVRAHHSQHPKHDQHEKQCPEHAALLRKVCPLSNQARPVPVQTAARPRDACSPATGGASMESEAHTLSSPSAEPEVRPTAAKMSGRTPQLGRVF